MTNEVQHWVRVGIVIIVAVIAAFDLLLLYRYGPDGTISVTLRQWGRDFPILPYLIAFGMGAFVYHIAYD